MYETGRHLAIAAQAAISEKVFFGLAHSSSLLPLVSLSTRLQSQLFFHSLQPAYLARIELRLRP